MQNHLTVAEATSRLQTAGFTIQDIPSIGPIAEWTRGLFRVTATLTPQCGAWVATVERQDGDAVHYLESVVGQELAKVVAVAEGWAVSIAGTTAYLAQYNRSQRARGAA